MQSSSLQNVDGNSLQNSEFRPRVGRLFDARPLRNRARGIARGGGQMLGFLKFLAGKTGRVVQGVIGGLLIMLALYWMDTTQGAVVGILGLGLLACGVFDVCAFAPFVGMPFLGQDLRKELHKRQLRPAARSSGMRLHR